MTRRRAVPKDHTIEVEGRLPMLYHSLAPIVPERHSGLYLRPERSYEDTAKLNVVPLICDEFAQALRHYPIIIAPSETPMPVALVGLAKGVNDHVDADGAWTEGHYIPAYLRRYPFTMLQDPKQTERRILCADLSSMQFTETASEGEALFEEDGSQSTRLAGILDFCNRYEQGMERTRRLMTQLAELDLIQPSKVNITRNGKTARIDGFSMIAEDKLRELPDATLADLARRGILSIVTAHHLSLANFTGIGDF